ncbi:MAG: sugar phosphate nucleotidyltransferase [Myxococcota bacterium]
MNEEKCTAFLLAAGFGTRLRPLTQIRPKPLLPVGGIPMLDLAYAWLRQQGHTNVLVNAHHLWPQIAAWAEENGAQLQVEQPDILGTGGGLRAALPRLADRVAIFNGDILADVDLGALQAACPEDGAAMALRTTNELGTITPVLDRDGQVIRIGDIIATDDAPPKPGGGPGQHFTGIHVMSRAAIERVPATGFACVVRTAYRDLVPEGRVQGVVHPGIWVDVGTPAAYLQANMDVLDGTLTLSIDPWSRAERGLGGSLIGAGARIEGEIDRCVIGAGAVIPQGASLRGCVVWDGVTAPEGVHQSAVMIANETTFQVQRG